jgi:hypothetical protein
MSSKKRWMVFDARVSREKRRAETLSSRLRKAWRKQIYAEEGNSATASSRVASLDASMTRGWGGIYAGIANRNRRKLPKTKRLSKDARSFNGMARLNNG